MTHEKWIKCFRHIFTCAAAALDCGTPIIRPARSMAVRISCDGTPSGSLRVAHGPVDLCT